MKEINFLLTLEEANQILAALGQGPYLQVYRLIEKIQQQAQEQLKPGTGKKEPEEALSFNGIEK